MGSKGTTQDEVRERVAITMALLIDGMDRGTIERSISKQYDLTTRQARNYISKARKAMTDELDDWVPYLVGEGMAQRRQLYQEMKQSGDLRGALMVLQDIGHLQGIYAPKRAELTGKDGTPLVMAIPDFAHMHPEELEQEINDLQKRSEVGGPGTAGPSFISAGSSVEN